MRNSAGNTLPEYVLIGAVVAVVTIAGLSLLGSNFGLVANALQNDLLGSYAGWFNSGGSGDPASFKTNMSITLSDGTTLNVPVSPQFKNYVETTGVNGNSLMLALMTELMRDAETKGKITSAQSNQILQLANQGHDIAQIQSIMESMAAKKKNGNAFLTTSVLFNGSYYSIDYLSSLLDNTKAGGRTQTMLSLSDTLGNQLSDKTLSKLIKDLSKQVATSADSYATLATDIAAGTQGTSSIAGAMASQSTNQISSSICTAGNNNTDNGEFCFQL